MLEWPATRGGGFAVVEYHDFHRIDFADRKDQFHTAAQQPDKYPTPFVAVRVSQPPSPTREKGAQKIGWA